MIYHKREKNIHFSSQFSLLRKKKKRAKQEVFVKRLIRTMGAK